MNALVKDLEAVINHLKINQAVFVGHSIGTQVLFEFYKRFPKKVKGIISCFGTYGHVMDHFYNSSLSPLILRLAYFLGTTFPKQSNLISRFLMSNPLSYWAGGFLKVMNIGMMNREECDTYIQHVLNMDPQLFSCLLKSCHEASAEELLRKIKVPVLILGGEDDQFTPAWISKKMHRLIPESELLMIHKATHAGLVEQPDLVNLRIEKFLEERI